MWMPTYTVDVCFFPINEHFDDETTRPCISFAVFKNPPKNIIEIGNGSHFWPAKKGKHILREGLGGYRT